MARPWYDQISTEIFANIRENHDSAIEGYFITSNQKEVDYVYNRLGREMVHPYNVAEYFEQHWAEFTYEKFCEYEKKYDCAPMWEYVYTDRFLIHRDREYCYRIVAGYFQFFEDLFVNEQVDFYFDEAVATIQTFVAYLVGRKTGTRYISQMLARGAGLDQKYHYFITDPFQYNDEMPENYADIEVTEEEYREMEDYLTNFEQVDVKPGCMSVQGKKPTLNKDVLLCPLKYLYIKHSKANNNPYFYIYYHHASDVLNPLRFYHRYKKSLRYYEEPDLNQKYVYFALHFQPEASTIVCAEKYEKQLFLIDQWAKSLPADTLLYVKEHYAQLGSRELSFYEELKKYPNVVLVNPWFNSRALIEHAEAVAALTGTVGFEGILLRKPVFVSADILYRSAPGVLEMDDIFHNYLPLMAEYKQPSREELIHYLAVYRRTLHEGCMVFKHPNTLTADNFRKLASSLYAKMKEMDS